MSEKLKQKWAEKYAQLYDETLMPYDAALDDTVLKKWLRLVDDGVLTLDYGCGTGRCLIPLAKKGADVIGIDVSVFMIQKTKIKLVKSLTQRARLLICDAENLPFKDETFQFVFSYGTLHHLPHPAGGLSEISRVLKKGGVFYALETRRTQIETYADVYSSIPFFKILSSLIQRYVEARRQIKVKKVASGVLTHPGHPGKEELVHIREIAEKTNIKIASMKSVYFPLFPFENKIKRNYALSLLIIKLCFLADKLPSFRDKGMDFFIEGYKTK